MDLSQSKTNNQTKFDSGVHFASYVSVGKNKKITSLKHHNTHAQENCALKFCHLATPSSIQQLLTNWLGNTQFLPAPKGCQQYRVTLLWMRCRFVSSPSAKPLYLPLGRKPTGLSILKSGKSSIYLKFVPSLWWCHNTIWFLCLGEWTQLQIKINK